MRFEAFKGVVWDHTTTIPGHDDLPTGVYRYAVVGVLVTNEPLDVHPNETILAGTCPGLGEILETTNRGECRYTLGNAAQVLTSLNDIVPVRASARPILRGCRACGEVVRLSSECNCGAFDGTPYVSAASVLAAISPSMERGTIVGDDPDEVRRAVERRAQAIAQAQE